MSETVPSTALSMAEKLLDKFEELPEGCIHKCPGLHIDSVKDSKKALVYANVLLFIIYFQIPVLEMLCTYGGMLLICLGLAAKYANISTKFIRNFIEKDAEELLSEEKFLDSAKLFHLHLQGFLKHCLFIIRCDHLYCTAGCFASLYVFSFLLAWMSLPFISFILMNSFVFMQAFRPQIKQVVKTGRTSVLVRAVQGSVPPEFAALAGTAAAAATGGDKKAD